MLYIDASLEWEAINPEDVYIHHIDISSNIMLVELQITRYWLQLTQYLSGIHCIIVNRL